MTPNDSVLINTNYKKEDFDIVSAYMNAQPVKAKSKELKNDTQKEIVAGKKQKTQSSGMKSSMKMPPPAIKVESNSELIQETINKTEEQIEERKEKGLFNWMSKPFKKKRKN